MAKHTLALSAEETAAIEWIMARDAEPTIPDVETWLYLKVRGELRAAQTGYALARNDAILEIVDKGDQAKSVSEVRADVADRLKTPRKKDEAIDAEIRK